MQAHDVHLSMCMLTFLMDGKFVRLIPILENCYSLFLSMFPFDIRSSHRGQCLSFQFQKVKFQTDLLADIYQGHYVDIICTNIPVCLLELSPGAILYNSAKAEFSRIQYILYAAIHSVPEWVTDVSQSTLMCCSSPQYFQSK